MTGKIDQTHRCNSPLLHVIWIHKDNPAPEAHSPVAIVEAIDGCIKLIVASQGLQDETSLGNLKLIERRA